MNIDASTLTATNDKSNYIAAYQTSKSGIDNAFKYQMESLSSDGAANLEEADRGVQPESEKESDTSISRDSSDDDSKVASKDGDKTQKTESTKDNQVKNEDSEQNQQEGQQNFQNRQEQQNQQNQQSAMLSDEIAQMLKLNAMTDSASALQNTNFQTGISRDVYTSAAAIDYSRFSMSEGDAMFFANLVTKTDMSMQSIAGEFQKNLNTANIQEVQKTAKVSGVLMEALADSMKTNKSFRIDFDKDVSVIMRVDRNGNLNANFIPGDKAVEAYLRNNISYLRQRFDEENLPYNELTYSKYKQQEQQSEKRKNKENDNE